jgi:hypothetical protein
MIPDKLNRKRLKFYFDKLAPETWEYLFDHEKENGLASCRTQGFGVRAAWYSTAAVMKWLMERNYYAEEEFQRPRAAGWKYPLMSLHPA